ncbi:MAG: HAD family phosphatase, partial [Erysipelotrichaceae bacterium]|nr:HAD family phosphatase [Erysipelotrichaceae bacterium]
MNRVKYIVFDLDNTLLDSMKTIPSQSLRYLKELRNNTGIKLGIASGRTLRSYGAKEKKYNLNEIMDFLILNDGCDIYDNDRGSHYEYEFLSYQQAREICRIFNKWEFVNVIFIGDGDMYAEKYTEELKDTMARQGIDHFLNVSEGMIGKIKRCVVVFERSRQEEIRKIRLDNPVNGVRYLFSEGHLLDVLPQGVSKRNALERYLNGNGDDWDSVMFFGDGENDMELIEKSGIGVAMKNAPERVRKIRDHVT